MAGQLFVVATPIGNLGDLSPRAVEVLKAVKVIAAEDTRHTRGLLERFGIATPTTSLPAFAEGERAQAILSRLEAGDDVALVTDAGTPAISDPGEKLVAEAIAAGVRVVPVPGPAAFVAALSAGGLPTTRFHFLGFLPRQQSEAKAMIEEVQGLSATLVIYESPRRLGETLAHLSQWLGPRRAVVARELTKLHEEFARDTLDALAARYATAEVLGEVVVLIEGRVGDARWSQEEVTRALRHGLEGGERLKTLCGELARRSGWSSGELYKVGLTLKS
ncbi:MAG: 16S rRNA (cytidine(1402)-2'-O)-methyltransferase [Myxococcaceae bacterium]